MQKIILERQKYGWSAMFFNVPGMPDDVEIPLPFTSLAYLQTVATDVRKRNPNARLLYRDFTGHLTQVATVCSNGKEKP